MSNTASLINDLRFIADHPQNYCAAYICRTAADELEKLAAAEQWHSKEDPLLMKLWGKYRQRTADTEMEVIVMINGGIVATTAYFDGEGFYDGVDPLPVIAWRPMPPAPSDNVPLRAGQRLMDADELIKESKRFFHELIDAGEENVEVTDFNVRFQEMIRKMTEGEGQADGLF